MNAPRQSPRVPVVGRRTLLLGGGAVLLAAACGGGDTASDDAARTTTDGGDGARRGTSHSDTTAPAGSDGTAVATDAELTAADFAAVGTCVLLPEQMAGPFPLDEQFDRRDITEGYPGHPMRLGLRVVDATCEPVPGAAVEIWHADATGDYSAFIDRGGGKDEGPGTTFLRGTQIANDEGIVEFLTIYPGWYPGRAVHIHLRVRVDGTLVLTSQLYFDEDYTASVYSGAPYAEFGLPDTSNASDGIAGDPASDGTLVMTRAAQTARGAGTLGLVNLGVRS